jgi:hypothetical protein
LPLAYYLATASAHGYWLDGGEFVAVARDLSISHPPGHPLNAIVGAFFALLPVGPLAYRVAVSSAVAASVAIAFFFRALFHTLMGLGERDRRRAGALSLAAAWLVASGSGYWLQAIRPEVYALEAALAAIVLDGIIRFELAQPSDDLRPLYFAAFCEGLSLANNHFLALVLLPAAAPTLGRVFARRGFTVLMGLTVAPLLGLATYAFLPIRAAQHPALNLGDPSSLTRLFWVISAEAFHKVASEGVPQPLSERVFDVLVGYHDTLSPVLSIIALGGLYLTLRVSHTRRFGLIWGIVLVLGTAARAWMGFVRGNPDALGYLMTAFMAIAALVACFMSFVLSSLAQHHGTLIRTTRAVCYGLCGLAGVQVVLHAEGQSLARFRAPDLLGDLRLRDLPARSVLLAHDPTTIFQHYGQEAEERLRPDVTLVPVPLLSYPGMVDSLLRQAPELAPLLRGYLFEGMFRVPLLQSLAGERPVLLELDPRVPLATYETLVPEGLLHRVVADGATATDVRQAAEQQASMYDELYARLGAERKEPQTNAILLWRHYLDALYYAALGDREAARHAVSLGLARQPLSRELNRLREALRDPVVHGPLDVRPFLPADQ